MYIIAKRLTLSKYLFCYLFQSTLLLWDTAGQETFDRLRNMAYTNTNVFVLVFNVMNPGSLGKGSSINDVTLVFLIVCNPFPPLCHAYNKVKIL